MSIVLEAPAKINLYLGVHKQKDARGYHRVDSLMVALGLCDEVRIQSASELQVVCVPEASFPQEKNTAFKAARLLGVAYGREPNVLITITKRIPEQSGMGGSSSDAAAVLKGLCEQWGIDVRNAGVFEVARAVGADVPFFLNPVPTLLVGAGDVPQEQFPPLDGVPVVIVRPNGPGVSTKQAYEQFDVKGRGPASYDALCEALREQNTHKVAANLANNLEPIACGLMPEIEEVKTWLAQRQGVLAAQVTGSGSSVFGICATVQEANQIMLEAQENPSWWACSTTVK